MQSKEGTRVLQTPHAEASSEFQDDIGSLVLLEMI